MVGDVGRFEDRIMSNKLSLELEIMHVISVYASQVGLDEGIKKGF